MKSRTLTLIIAAVMLIAVGVLVWPEPKQAMAADLDVQLTLTWNCEDAEDVEANAELLDANGDPFDPPIIIPLTPNAPFTVWSGTFLNVPAQASRVRFVWIELGLEWFPPSPIVKSLNWSGTTFGESSVQCD
ncbi:MAG: hypothetical protein FJY67_08100 [Calditrichaeota bacterium]|nr:hypothetical protein [Calditrichota bacterium]